MTLDALELPTTKGDLLAQIEREYDDLVALMRAKPTSEVLAEWDDGRSLKDLVVHIADWEAYALARLRNSESGNVVPARIVEEGDLDRVNAEILERSREMSWERAWAWWQEMHAEMTRQIADMKEEDIFDPERNEFSVMDPDTNVLHLIFYNTSEHYREHADELRRTNQPRS